MPKTTQSNMHLGIFAATCICIGLTGENFVHLSSVQFIKHLMTILQLEKEKKNREKIHQRAETGPERCTWHCHCH